MTWYSNLEMKKEKKQVSTIINGLQSILVPS